MHGKAEFGSLVWVGMEVSIPSTCPLLPGTLLVHLTNDGDCSNPEEVGELRASDSVFSAMDMPVEVSCRLYVSLTSWGNTCLKFHCAR